MSLLVMEQEMRLEVLQACPLSPAHPYTLVVALAAVWDVSGHRLAQRAQ